MCLVLGSDRQQVDWCAVKENHNRSVIIMTTEVSYYSNPLNTVHNCTFDTYTEGTFLIIFAIRGWIRGLLSPLWLFSPPLQRHLSFCFCLRPLDTHLRYTYVLSPTIMMFFIFFTHLINWFSFTICAWPPLHVTMVRAKRP